MRRKAFSGFLLVASLCIFFFPTKLLASSCQCANKYYDRGGIAQTSQESCDRVANEQECKDKQSSFSSSKTCKFYLSENCDPTTYFDSSNFTISESSCSSKQDCDILSQNQGKTQCVSGLCYFDDTAKRTYDQTHVSVLGIDRDLKIKKPVLEINIPGLNFSDNLITSVDEQGRKTIKLAYLSEYVSVMYKYGVGIVTIVAVAVIIFQGARVIVSAGGEEKVAAYKRIGQVIIGLGLLWGSYTILYILNPDFVGLRIINVPYVERMPLPEEDESIPLAEYPKSVENKPIETPKWNYQTFDCEANKNTPAGVVAASAVITYTCPYIDNKITTIPEMKDPLCKAAELAHDQGYTIHINPDGGSYRSYEAQVRGWCNDPRKPEDKKSFRAVPGFSNHGHGRAVDVFLVQNGNQLFGADSKAQCDVGADLVAKIANFFYQADPNFVRLDTEIWHFEYGTAGQSARSKITTNSTKCKKK